MKRDVDITQIWDGRYYGPSDLVRADTAGCSGCSHCCREMTDTIFLDPWDIYSLSKATGSSFEEMIDRCLLLEMADGLILPRLKGRENGSCVFLDENGRCSIHAYRPGFCRLFPLGRVYEGRTFRYFLQADECVMKNRAKVKVKKWLGIPNLALYENYIEKWHGFILDAGALLEGAGESLRKSVCMAYLKTFFLQPYDTDADFYAQFEERLENAYRQIGMAPPR